MKFAKHLETESVAEWRRAYINYKGLKRKLDAIEKHRQTSDLAANAQKEQQQKQHNGAPTTLQDASANFGTTTNPTPPQLQRYISWRLRRCNTLTSSHSDVQQQEQAHHLSTKRNIMDRLSRPLSRGDAERGQAYSPPISLDVDGLDELLPFTNEPERNFLAMLDQELEKISQFYNEKEQESQDKFDSLKMQLELVKQYRQQRARKKRAQDDTLEHRLNPVRWFHSQKPLNATAPSSTTILSATVIDEGEHHISYKVARSRLKAAIPEFYRSLELLRSYKILNEMGFQKILKKFDKTARWKASTIYDKKLKMYHWVKSDVLDNIIQDTERFFVNEFTNGHRRRGMKKLRIPENHGDYATATWRIGFCLGACIAIFARVIQLVLDPSTQEQLPLLAYNMNIYSCVILPLLFTLGFAVNMVVWHRSHINYRFIFELNPRNCLNYRQFAELPSFMLLLTSVIMYIDVSQCWAPVISSQLCPLILVLLILAILFCPFQIFHLSARQWLGITLGRIALSGLLPVEFRDFFIADELNSLAFSLWMGIYFFCVYSWHWNDLATHCNVPKMWVSPCLACLPPLWRGLQCLRRYHSSKEVHHLVNGLKYVTSIMATIFVGVRRISPSPTVEALWIIVSIINSTYTSIWDIKMDWGLLNMNSQHYLLRDDLVFYKWTYYVAIPINIVLRFSWAINKAGLAYNLPILTFLTALLEAIRRIMWNFYRLENEHLNNCGHYRAIKEIPLPFILTLDEIPVPPIEGNHQGEEEQQQLQSTHPSLLVHEDLADPSLLSVNNSNRLSNLDHSTDSSRNNSRNSGNSRHSKHSKHSAVLPIALVDQGGGTLAKPGGPIVATGSFYGCRDFETRQDKDDDGKLGLVRQSSMVGQVLDRIRTLAAPNTTDSDSCNDNEDDDDNNDDDDDDEDSE